ISVNGTLQGTETNTTVNVSDSGEISDAIAVVKTSGTVNLAGKSYNEEVEINKDLSLNVVSGTAIAKSWKSNSDKTVTLNGEYATSDDIENNDFTFEGDVLLGERTRLSTDNESHDGNISFNSNVDAKSTETNSELILNIDGGNAEFIGAVGGKSSIAAITIESAKDVAIKNTLSSKGNINIQSNGNIVIENTMTGQGDIVISGSNFDNTGGKLNTTGGNGKIAVDASESIQVNADIISGEGNIELGKNKKGEIQLASNLTSSSEIVVANNAKIKDKNVIIKAGTISTQQIDQTGEQDLELTLDAPTINLNGNITINGTLHGTDNNTDVNLDSSGEIGDALKVVKDEGYLNLDEGSYEEDVVIEKNISLSVESGTAIAKNWKTGIDTTVSMNGNFGTSDNEENDFTFEGKLLLKDQVSLSTENTQNDGNITFNKSVDASSTEDTANLTLKSGGGTVNLNDAIGSEKNIGNLTVQSASQATFNAISTKGNIDIDAATTSFQNIVNTQGSVNVSGNLDLNNNITTTGKDISLNTVKINGNVALKTGDESPGNIQIAGKLDGSISDMDEISFNAGQGNIDFQDKTGEDIRLKTLTIDKANNFSLNASVKTQKMSLNATNDILINADILVDKNIDLEAQGEIKLAADMTSENGNIDVKSPVRLKEKDVIVKAKDIITTHHIDYTNDQKTNLKLEAPIINLNNTISVLGELQGSDLNEVVNVGISGEITDAIDVVKTNGNIYLSDTSYAENVLIDKDVSLNVDTGKAIAQSWTFESDKTVVLNGEYGTSDNENNNFSFEGKVLLKGQVILSTDNTLHDGNITFNKSIDANILDETANLNLSAGNGSVSFNDDIGAEKDIGSLTVQSASQVILNAATTKGNIDIEADKNSLQNTINSQGSINISGDVEIKDDIVTTGENISLNNVKVNGNVALKTGDEIEGNILITGTLDGTTQDVDEISLSAGQGDIKIQGTTGEAIRLKSLTVNKTKDVLFENTVKTQSMSLETTNDIQINKNIITDQNLSILAQGEIKLAADMTSENGNIDVKSAARLQDKNVSVKANQTLSIQHINSTAEKVADLTLEGQTINLNDTISINGNLQGSEQNEIINVAQSAKINDAIAIVKTNGNVNLSEGSYSEDVLMNKDLSLNLTDGTALAKSWQSESDKTIILNGEYATLDNDNNNFTFNGPVLLKNKAILTTNNDTKDGSIIFNNSVDAHTTEATANLIMDAGEGTVNLNGETGGENMIGNLTVQSASQAVFNAVSTKGSIDINAGMTTLQNDIDSEGTVNISDILNLNANILTKGNDISLNSVKVNGIIKVETGAESAGNILIADKLDGTTTDLDEISLNAGQGNIDIKNTIGETQRLKTVTVNNVNNVSLEGTTRAESVSLNATTDIQVNEITTDADISLKPQGEAKLKANLTSENGNIDINSMARLQNNDVIIKAKDVITTQQINSTDGQTANLTLEAPTINLNGAISINGNLQGGTTNATVNVGQSGEINDALDVVMNEGEIQLASVVYTEDVDIKKDVSINVDGTATAKSWKSGSETKVILYGNYATSENKDNDFNFEGQVLLGKDVSLSTNNEVNDGKITFNKTVDAKTSETTANLVLNTGEGEINIKDVVGGENLIGQLTIQSASQTIIDKNISTKGKIDISGNTTLNGDFKTSGGDIKFDSVKVNGGVRLDTGNDLSGNINITGKLDGATVDVDHIIFNSGTGNVEFSENIGETVRLKTLTVEKGENVSLNGTLTASGNVAINAKETLLAAEIKTNGGNVTIGTENDGIIQLGANISTIDESDSEKVGDIDLNAVQVNGEILLTGKSVNIHKQLDAQEGSQNADLSIIATSTVELKETVGSEQNIGNLVIRANEKVLAEKTIQSQSLDFQSTNQDVELKANVTTNSDINLKGKTGVKTESLNANNLSIQSNEGVIDLNDSIVSKANITLSGNKVDNTGASISASGNVDIETQDSLIAADIKTSGGYVNIGTAKDGNIELLADISTIEENKSENVGDINLNAVQINGNRSLTGNSVLIHKQLNAQVGATEKDLVINASNNVELKEAVGNGQNLGNIIIKAHGKILAEKTIQSQSMDANSSQQDIELQDSLTTQGNLILTGKTGVTTERLNGNFLSIQSESGTINLNDSIVSNSNIILSGNKVDNTGGSITALGKVEIEAQETLLAADIKTSGGNVIIVTVNDGTVKLGANISTVDENNSENAGDIDLNIVQINGERTLEGNSVRINKQLDSQENATDANLTINAKKTIELNENVGNTYNIGDLILSADEKIVVKKTILCQSLQAVSSNQDIELQGNVIAENDVNLTGKTGVKTQAFNVNKLTINSEESNIDLNDVIVARGDISLTGKNVDNTEASITSSGKVDIDAQNIILAADVKTKGGNVIIGTARDGIIHLDANISTVDESNSENVGNIDLNAVQIKGERLVVGNSVRIFKELDAQKDTTNANLTITASNTIEFKDTVGSNNNLGNLNIYANGKVLAEKTIQSQNLEIQSTNQDIEFQDTVTTQNDIHLTGKTGVKTEDVNTNNLEINSEEGTIDLNDKIVSQGNFILSGKKVDNTNASITVSGNVNIDAQETLLAAAIKTSGGNVTIGTANDGQIQLQADISTIYENNENIGNIDLNKVQILDNRSLTGNSIRIHKQLDAQEGAQYANLRINANDTVEFNETVGKTLSIGDLVIEAKGKILAEKTIQTKSLDAKSTSHNIEFQSNVTSQDDVILNGKTGIKTNGLNVNNLTMQSEESSIELNDATVIRGTIKVEANNFDNTGAIITSSGKVDIDAKNILISSDIKTNGEDVVIGTANDGNILLAANILTTDENDSQNTGNIDLNTVQINGEISLVGNSVRVHKQLDAQEGAKNANLTIEAKNAVELKDTVGFAHRIGDFIITTNGNILAENTIQSQSLDIQSTEGDIDLNGAIDSRGNVTLSSNKVDNTGAIISASGNVDIDARDTLIAAEIKTNGGNVTIGTENEDNIQLQADISTIDENNIENIGNIDLNSVKINGNLSLSGNSVRIHKQLDAQLDATEKDLVINASNTVDLKGAVGSENNLGNIVINANGKVLAENTIQSQSLDFQSTNQDIEFKANVTTDSDIKLQGKTGVKTESLNANNLNIQSTAGDIDLNDAILTKGNIILAGNKIDNTGAIITTSGNVDIEAQDTLLAAEIKTNGGNVNIGTASKGNIQLLADISTIDESDSKNIGDIDLNEIQINGNRLLTGNSIRVHEQVYAQEEVADKNLNINAVNTVQLKGTVGNDEQKIGNLIITANEKILVEKTIQSQSLKVMSSNQDIELQGNVTTQDNINLTGKTGIKTEGLNGNIITIQSEEGTIDLNDSIVSRGDIIFSGNKVDNTGSSITSSGKVDIDAQDILITSEIKTNGGNITIGTENDGSIQLASNISTIDENNTEKAGDINLNTVQINGKSSLTGNSIYIHKQLEAQKDATNVDLTINANNTVEFKETVGSEQSLGNLNIEAGGKILAKKTIHGQSMDAQSSNQDIDLQGTVITQDGVNLIGKTGVKTEGFDVNTLIIQSEEGTIDLNDSIVSKGDIFLLANKIENDGSSITASGNVDINANDTLLNAEIKTSGGNVTIGTVKNGNIQLQANISTIDENNSENVGDIDLNTVHINGERLLKGNSVRVHQKLNAQEGATLANLTISADDTIELKETVGDLQNLGDLIFTASRKILAEKTIQSQSINAKSENQDIEFKGDVSTQNNINLSGKTGVKTERLNGDNLTIRSEAGMIDLNNDIDSRANVSLSGNSLDNTGGIITASGNVDIEAQETMLSADIKTSGGNVNIKTENNGFIKLDANISTINESNRENIGDIALDAVQVIGERLLKGNSIRIHKQLDAQNGASIANLTINADNKVELKDTVGNVQEIGNLIITANEEIIAEKSIQSQSLQAHSANQNIELKDTVVTQNDVSLTGKTGVKAEGFNVNKLTIQSEESTLDLNAGIISRGDIYLSANHVDNTGANITASGNIDINAQSVLLSENIKTNGGNVIIGTEKDGNIQLQANISTIDENNSKNFGDIHLNAVQIKGERSLAGDSVRIYEKIDAQEDAQNASLTINASDTVELHETVGSKLNFGDLNITANGKVLAVKTILSQSVQAQSDQGIVEFQDSITTQNDVNLTGKTGVKTEGINSNNLTIQSSEGNIDLNDAIFSKGEVTISGNKVDNKDANITASGNVDIDAQETLLAASIKTSGGNVFIGKANDSIVKLEANIWTIDESNSENAGDIDLNSVQIIDKRTLTGNSVRIHKELDAQKDSTDADLTIIANNTVELNETVGNDQSIRDLNITANGKVLVEKTIQIQNLNIKSNQDIEIKDNVTTQNDVFLDGKTGVKTEGLNVNNLTIQSANGNIDLNNSVISNGNTTLSGIIIDNTGAIITVSGNVKINSQDTIIAAEIETNGGNIDIDSQETLIAAEIETKGGKVTIGTENDGTIQLASNISTIDESNSGDIELNFVQIKGEPTLQGNSVHILKQLDTKEGFTNANLTIIAKNTVELNETVGQSNRLGDLFITANGKILAKKTIQSQSMEVQSTDQDIVLQDNVITENDLILNGKTGVKTKGLSVNNLAIRSEEGSIEMSDSIVSKGFINLSGRNIDNTGGSITSSGKVDIDADNILIASEIKTNGKDIKIGTANDGTILLKANISTIGENINAGNIDLNAVLIDGELSLEGNSVRVYKQLNALEGSANANLTIDANDTVEIKDSVGTVQRIGNINIKADGKILAEKTINAQNLEAESIQDIELRDTVTTQHNVNLIAKTGIKTEGFNVNNLTIKSEESTIDLNDTIVSRGEVSLSAHSVDNTKALITASGNVDINAQSTLLAANIKTSGGNVIIGTAKDGIIQLEADILTVDESNNENVGDIDLNAVQINGQHSLSGNSIHIHKQLNAKDGSTNADLTINASNTVLLQETVGNNNSLGDFNITSKGKITAEKRLQSLNLHAQSVDQEIELKDNVTVQNNVVLNGKTGVKTEGLNVNNLTIQSAEGTIDLNDSVFSKGDAILSGKILNNTGAIITASGNVDINTQDTILAADINTNGGNVDIGTENDGIIQLAANISTIDENNSENIGDIELNIVQIKGERTLRGDSVHILKQLDTQDGVSNANLTINANNNVEFNETVGQKNGLGNLLISANEKILAKKTIKSQNFEAESIQQDIDLQDNIETQNDIVLTGKTGVKTKGFNANKLTINSESTIDLNGAIVSRGDILLSANKVDNTGASISSSNNGNVVIDMQEALLAADITTNGGKVTIGTANNGTIKLGANISTNTGDIELNAVQITGKQTLTGKSVLIKNTIEAQDDATNSDLTINAGDTVEFKGTVGENNRIGNLLITANGKILAEKIINSQSLEASSNQQGIELQDNIITQNDVKLTGKTELKTKGFDVDTLTIQSPEGDIYLNGDIVSKGNIELSGNKVDNTDASISASGNVDINAQDILLAAEINTNGGNVNIGTKNDGNIQLLANISTKDKNNSENIGNIDLNTVQISGERSLEGKSVHVHKKLDAKSGDTNANLTINASDTIVLTEAVGSIKKLANFNITANGKILAKQTIESQTLNALSTNKNIEFLGNVFTTGNMELTGKTGVTTTSIDGNNLKINSENGDISLKGEIVSNGDISINSFDGDAQKKSEGDVSINGTITALNTITLQGKEVQFINVVEANSLIVTDATKVIAKTTEETTNKRIVRTTDNDNSGHLSFDVESLSMTAFEFDLKIKDIKLIDTIKATPGTVNAGKIAIKQKKIRFKSIDLGTTGEIHLITTPDPNNSEQIYSKLDLDTIESEVKGFLAAESLFIDTGVIGLSSKIQVNVKSADINLRKIRQSDGQSGRLFTEFRTGYNKLSNISKEIPSLSFLFVEDFPVFGLEEQQGALTSLATASKEQKNLEDLMKDTLNPKLYQEKPAEMEFQDKEEAFKSDEGLGIDKNASLQPGIFYHHGQRFKNYMPTLLGIDLKPEQSQNIDKVNRLKNNLSMLK
ncbi:hypothetical protein MHK_006812, partial [Candidatus Magnetomorum sp. HK-1]